MLKNCQSESQNEKSVTKTCASVSSFNSIWKVTVYEFYERKQHPFFFLRLGWGALFTAPLPFCLNVLGFHQMKKSRQGQGRWMTSMASRYFQGRVIETNEPCYISWDTESCCSKIESLIELKLEAPNLSADHRCHGAPEEERSQRACFTGLALSVFTWTTFVFFSCELTHTHIQRYYSAFKDCVGSLF